MKPTTTIALSLITLIASTTVLFLNAREGLGIAVWLIGLVPVLALIASKPLAKPWFMDGVEWDPPKTTLSAVMAALADSWAAFLAFSGTSAWVIITTRLILTLCQLAVVGRFTTDTQTNHENNSTDHRRCRKGHPGKS